MSDQEGATQPARDERARAEQQTKQPERAGGGTQRDRERGRRRHGQQNQPRRPEAQLPMEELRDLFALFTEHGLTEFELERESFRVHLGRNQTQQGVSSAPAFASPTPPAQVSVPAETQSVAAGNAPVAPVASPAEALETEEESLHIIVSPIVGTFYRSASPTAEPFVRLGSHVELDTVVCIIEAMKLMNEIQAETSGEVAKIYVENGQPVEFGQPLFGVKK
jgi:acetyl-CoA carboxylase biotin carboxyl carrier protein